MSGPGADGSAADGSAGRGEERSAESAAQRRTTEWERARRRAEVFGETLPETTSDEREAGGVPGPRDSDAWLREQVPPHHGG